MMRADKFDLSRLLRETLSCERPTKRAVKGLSLDGALRPLP
jgi:hypothetical protein